MSRTSANEHQRLASDPGVSAWVNANAGSGKTHVLIDRLIRLMLAGNAPQHILCLTYTKAAAAEMADRLFKRLGRWTTLADDALDEHLREAGIAEIDEAMRATARRLFTAALETPGGLKIQTIHAFCERLLQLFPVEAGIVPRFTVMDQRQTTELLGLARAEVMARASRQPSSPLGLAMAEVARQVNSDTFDKMLATLMGRRDRLHLFLGEGGPEAAEAALRPLLDLQSTDDVERLTAELSLDRARYSDFAAALAKGSKADADRARTLAEVLAGPSADLLMLEGFYLTKKGEPRAMGGIATKPVVTRLGWLNDFIAEEQERLVKGLGRLADLGHVTATGNLLRVARAVDGAFTAAKRARGAYDFGDLIFHTERLLTARPDAAWVLYKLDGGIAHILLDEAQDTAPAQWAIIKALAGEFFAGAGASPQELRTVFAVGDRKQSIFSFQGADPAIFETVHDDFEALTRGGGRGLKNVVFTVSFRSAQAVLQAVDAVFATGTRARDGLDGKAEGLVHEPTREGAPGTVELWPLVEPVEKDDDQPWQAPVDRPPTHAPHLRLARQIAETIGSWVGRRHLPALERTVTPGDILILVRKRSALFDALIRELRNAGLPVAGADRLELGEALAVQDLLALAGFALLPSDDYALACLLKSPVLARPISEDELFTVAFERGSRSLWERLQETFPALAAELAGWIALARETRPYEFFAAALAQCRVRMVTRLGGEANDAADALLEQALAYEASASASLQGFVHWFAAGKSDIRRDMEQAAGQIRVMTVHGAKGLEAPIVILPDTTGKSEGQQEPLLLVDIGEASLRLPLWRRAGQFVSRPSAALKLDRSGEAGHEHRRLLYVAMTRARDELYICGCRGRNDPPADCWYELMAEPLRPVMREIPGTGWRLGVDPVAGRAGPAVAPLSKPVLPDWLSAAPPAEAAVAASVAPSRLGDGALPPTPAMRRGSLIHAILQLLPETRPEARDALIRRMVSRAGVDDAVAAELLAITGDPELSQLFGSDGLSEVPVRVNLPGGLTISGRIDRLILTPERVTIIDYKTERAAPADPESTPESYLAQLAAYWASLSQLYPAQEVGCAILWTAVPRLMHIPPALLAQHIPVARP